MIAVRVQPRASRDGVAGERGGAIVVRLTAPAEGGKANRALIRLIADRARVPRGAVEIVRGRRSREKLVRVEGLTDAALRTALLS